jgi:hypothetical protein
VPCDYCGVEFDPIATRWLCPHCHMKANCCDGAPLAAREANRSPAEAPEPPGRPAQPATGRSEVAS